MKAPRRFSEDPEFRRALTEATPGPQLSDARRAALRGALAGAFAVAPLHPAPPSAGGAKLPWVLGGAGTAGVALVAAVLLKRPEEVAAAPPPPPPRQEEVVPVVAPREPVPLPSLLVAPSPRPSSPRPTSPPAAPVDALAAELALLREARAFATSDPARAQRALDAHRDRFPAGKLAMERDVLLVEVLFRRGDVARATVLRDELLRQAPNGPFARRLERASAQK